MSGVLDSKNPLYPASIKMNTLTDRMITPADVLAERLARSKVLYSPCQDCDIKWRDCMCFVCRSVWDPTGEEDAERINKERGYAPEPNPEIPTSLPPLTGSTETVQVSKSDMAIVIRLLDSYANLLKTTIEQMRQEHERLVQTSEDYPLYPPEFDTYLCDRYLTLEAIKDLKKKQ